MAREGAEAVSVRLGGIGGQSQAQLDGFKTRALRALRAQAPAQRHLYAHTQRDERTRIGISEVDRQAADFVNAQAGEASCLQSPGTPSFFDGGRVLFLRATFRVISYRATPVIKATV